MKHILLSICLLALSGSIANGDLRYRTQVQVRSITAALKEALPTGKAVLLVRGDAIPRRADGRHRPVSLADAV